MVLHMSLAPSVNVCFTNRLCGCRFGACPFCSAQGLLMTGTMHGKDWYCHFFLTVTVGWAAWAGLLVMTEK